MPPPLPPLWIFSMENQTPYPLPPKSSTVILQAPASWEPRRWQTGSSVDHLWKEKRVYGGGRVGWEPGSQSIPGSAPSQAMYWHRNDFSLLIPALVLVHVPWGCFCSACAHAFICTSLGDLLEKGDIQEWNVIMVWLYWHLRGISMIGPVSEVKSGPGQRLLVP